MIHVRIQSIEVVWAGSVFYRNPLLGLPWKQKGSISYAHGAGLVRPYSLTNSLSRNLAEKSLCHLGIHKKIASTTNLEAWFSTSINLQLFFIIHCDWRLAFSFKLHVWSLNLKNLNNSDCARFSSLKLMHLCREKKRLRQSNIWNLPFSK